MVAVYLRYTNRWDREPVVVCIPPSEPTLRAQADLSLQAQGCVLGPRVRAFCAVSEAHCTPVTPLNVSLSLVLSHLPRCLGSSALCAYVTRLLADTNAC